MCLKNTCPTLVLRQIARIWRLNAASVDELMFGLQALGPGDPNYVDDAPADAAPVKGATLGDAVQAAAMSSIPTGAMSGQSCFKTNRDPNSLYPDLRT